MSSMTPAVIVFIIRTGSILITSQGWVWASLSDGFHWWGLLMFIWIGARSAGCLKQLSIEPPRSSVHCVEEEGEGFWDSRQQQNQEIRPKTLNSHPRLSAVVMHTPTQGDENEMVFLFSFCLFWHSAF